jgi:hypothetical protein
MSQIETVAAINDPAFKTGMGKNGKNWTLAQITTDKNNVASVFMPIEIGNKVEMTWNDTYGNWSAKKVNVNEAANIEAMKKLFLLNLAIYKAVTGEDYGKAVTVQPVAAPVAPVAPVAAPKQESPYTEADMIAEQVDNFDMSQIPF